MTIIKKASFRFIVIFSTLLFIFGTIISLCEFVLTHPSNEVSAQQPTQIEDVLPDTDEEENNLLPPQDVQKPKGAYEILEYSFSLLPKYENIIVTSTSSIGKNVLGAYISQDIMIKYQRAGVSELEENFGSGFQNMYRYGYSADGKDYKFLHISECDENYNRDISGETPIDTTKSEILAKYQGAMFMEYILTPSRSMGTVTTFDRVSNDDLYIINFSVTNIPEEYYKPFRASLSTDNVVFNSLNLNIYIDKSSYKIRLINRIENLTFDFKGISITVGSVTTTKFEYPANLQISMPV